MLERELLSAILTSLDTTSVPIGIATYCSAVVKMPAFLSAEEVCPNLAPTPRSTASGNHHVTCAARSSSCSAQITFTRPVRGTCVAEKILDSAREVVFCPRHHVSQGGHHISCGEVLLRLCCLFAVCSCTCARFLVLRPVRWAQTQSTVVSGVPWEATSGLRYDAES